MSAKSPILLLNKAQANQINQHLLRCDDSFSPHLSSTVCLDQYAEKLFSKAQRLELWVDELLVGLLAFYLNEEFVFITNISLEESWRGSHYAKTMLEECEYLALDNKLNTVRLEVGSANDRARAFYQRNGFTKHAVQNQPSLLRLEKTLKSTQ